jgi:hypothetical protein
MLINKNNPVIKILYFLIMIPLVLLPFPLPLFRRKPKNTITISEQK